MATVANVDQYADLPLTLTTDKSQAMGIEAIKNVIKMYLWSVEGDYGRGDVKKGGLLFDMIGKQLTDSNAQALKGRIEKALSQFKYVVINNISTGIDIPNKRFTVSIVFSDTYNKFISNIDFAIDGSA